MSAARSASSADRFRRAASSRRKDETTGQAPARGTTARRTKPVRITIDLTPEDYARMRRLVAELADQSGIPTLAHSRMWRVLLARLADDPGLLTDVADRIRAEE